MKIHVASGKLTVKKLRGDRVRFKSVERSEPYTAVYRDTDRHRVFVVLGREEWEGSPVRPRVDAPPFYIWPRDVVLAWESPTERRAALLAAGHER